MDACYCMWDDSVFQSGPPRSNPRQSSRSAESVTASSIHHSGLVVGRCTPQLPGDRGNTCPALLGTSSSRHSFVSLCLKLNVGPQENCESSTFVVICCLYTKNQGKGETAFPPSSHTRPLPYSSPRKKGHALNGPHTTAMELHSSQKTQPIQAEGKQAGQEKKHPKTSASKSSFY